MPRRAAGAKQLRAPLPDAIAAFQHESQRHYDAQQRRWNAKAPLGRRFQKARQLHAQHDEDDPVQHELQGRPHALGLQLGAGRGSRVALGQ